MNNYLRDETNWLLIRWQRNDSQWCWSFSGSRSKKVRHFDPRKNSPTRAKNDVFLQLRLTMDQKGRKIDHLTFHTTFSDMCWICWGKRLTLVLKKQSVLWNKVLESKYFFVFVFVFKFVLVFVFKFVFTYVFVFEAKDWHLFWKSNLFCGLRPGRESLSDSRRSNLRSNNNNFRNNISYLLFVRSE